MTPVALSRWLGSKRWLTANHAHMLPLPTRGGRAFDVFAGSCSVAFWYLAQGIPVVIGDTNARLIGTLRNLRERPEAVIGTLAAEASANTDAADRKADFVARRAHLNRLAPTSLEASALFLLVLRAGFNGLWRENGDGACNVPYGDPRPGKDLVRADELRAIGALLQRADIRLGDFEATSADAKRGDAIYFDAPYAPDKGKAGFVGYSRGGFTLADRQRLGALLRALDRRGVKWTLSDAATTHAGATYGLWSVEEVDVRRSVAAKGKDRVKAREVLVRNWHVEKRTAA